MGRSPALAGGTAVGSSDDSADLSPKPERWRLRSACSGGLHGPGTAFTPAGHQAKRAVAHCLCRSFPLNESIHSRRYSLVNRKAIFEPPHGEIGPIRRARVAEREGDYLLHEVVRRVATEPKIIERVRKARPDNLRRMVQEDPEGDVVPPPYVRDDPPALLRQPGEVFADGGFGSHFVGRVTD